MADPRAVMERLTVAQNAHDLEAMLECFHADYRSEQPLFPSRNFEGVDQVRANWGALLEAIGDLRGEIVRSAVDGDTVFAEIHWTGTKADDTPLEYAWSDHRGRRRRPDRVGAPLCRRRPARERRHRHCRPRHGGHAQLVALA